LKVRQGRCASAEATSQWWAKKGASYLSIRTGTQKTRERTIRAYSHTPLPIPNHQSLFTTPCSFSTPRSRRSSICGSPLPLIPLPRAGEGCTRLWVRCVL